MQIASTRAQCGSRAPYFFKLLLDERSIGWCNENDVAILGFNARHVLPEGQAQNGCGTENSEHDSVFGHVEEDKGLEISKGCGPNQ
jgi:hypothetical protein